MKAGEPQAEWRILNTEPGRFSAKAHAALRALGETATVEADRDYLLAQIAGFNVLFIALRNTIDAEIIEKSDRLSCIATPTTGTNHIDVEAARRRGIEILSLKGETEFLRGITATAELTWALLLSLIRKVPSAHASVMQAQWQRDLFYGAELQGKTLGIVGYGRLGTMVAAYGQAFRMTVLAFDHKPASAPPNIEQVDLPELLQRSDIVSIHLPLSTDTRGFFDATRLARMKHGALLINTARGEIVDEAALVDALERGKLAGAAVDVLASETSLDPNWLANSPLLIHARSHDNVLITPHIGGVTHESVENANLFMIAKLQRYLHSRRA